MPLMSLEFTLTQADLQKAIRLYTIKANEHIWWITGLFYLPLSLFNVWYNVQQNFAASSSQPLLLLALIAIPVFLFSRTYFVPGRAAAQQTDSQTLIRKTSWVLGEGELAVKNDLLDVKMGWDFFQNVVENDTCYYLVYKENKNCFQLLPKHVWHNRSDENEFRHILETKIGGIHTTTVGIAYRISMISFAILAILNIMFLFYSNFQ